MPGPGLYVSESGNFGKSVKGAANMGSKYKPILNANPGPGQYANQIENTKSSQKNIKISQA